MPISTPSQISVPFATSGLKNSIPSSANPVTGNAGYDAGFPAINMTPKEAGGIAPFGQDFNGILFDITTAIRFLEAGASFPFSSAFSTAVGGYPLGALVSMTDGAGLWRNTVANNTTDPETFGAGWQPERAGISTVPMTSANVTLTALQAARPIIIITGTLTANLNLIFPTYQNSWSVLNRATGAFSVTAKTSAGSGVAIPTGISVAIVGDGTNIVSASYAVQSSVTDTTAGRAMIVGAFGLGGDPIALAPTDNLNSPRATGYYYSSGSINSPSGYGNGFLTHQNLGDGSSFAAQTFRSLSGFSLTRTLNAGVWGSWSSLNQITDPWETQPIGVPIGLFTDIAPDSFPPTNKSYRYISLSAGDGYNAGVLTGETVTGTGPLLEATAVINLSGSPLNGKTVRLINTERRVLRAGLSGTVQGDQFQGFVFASPDNQPLAYHNSGTSVPATGVSTGREAAFRVPDGTWTSAIVSNDGVNGTPRIGSETRSKNIGITYFLRVK